MLNYHELRTSTRMARKALSPTPSFTKIAFIYLAAILIILLVNGCAWASTDDIDVNRLASAIGRAENSKAHPYGILAHYKHTSARQACINTIKHAMVDWSEDMRVDFITFLGRRYCPIGADNDPTGLNKNWIKNVRYYYEQY